MKQFWHIAEGYYVEFEREQYDDAFQFNLEIVKTFIQ